MVEGETFFAPIPKKTIAKIIRISAEIVKNKYNIKSYLGFSEYYYENIDNPERLSSRHYLREVNRISKLEKELNLITDRYSNLQCELIADDNFNALNCAGDYGIKKEY